MITCEQRAHDIAIGVLDKIISLRIENMAKEAVEFGDDQLSIDPYEIYKELYDTVLPLVEKDFPND